MEQIKKLIEKIKTINYKKIPKIVFISLAGFIFALYYVVSSAKSTTEIIPIREPASKPYVNTLAGLGIIEALDQSIAVKPNYNGKVTSVLVREGAKVKKGDVLYCLDVEDLSANLESLESDAKVKKITVEKLKNQPRNVEIPPLKASVIQSEANYENAKLQWQRLNNVSDQRAVSQDELSKKHYEMKQAEAVYEKNKADLNRVLAGAWSYDIKNEEAQYQSLNSKIKQMKIQINRATVVAPRDGEVLKVSIREGEFVSTNSDIPPLILGSNNKLQVRVDIDEINASNYHPGVKATACLKGDSGKRFPVKFVRLQPYMVPKANLSGMSTERVDVRVLQVIYDFAPPKFPVYVGQQVDVFFDN